MLDPSKFFGTISENTLIIEDILETILIDHDFNQLTDDDMWKPDRGRLKEFKLAYLKLRKEFVDIREDKEMSDTDKNIMFNDIMDDVFNLMNELVMPGIYFGAHPGNGSDIGYWFTDEVTNLIETLIERGFPVKSEEDDGDYDPYIKVYLTLVEMLEFLSQENEWNHGTCDLDITDLRPEQILFGYGAYDHTLLLLEEDTEDPEEYIKELYWIYPQSLYMDILITK